AQAKQVCLSKRRTHGAPSGAIEINQPDLSGLIQQHIIGIEVGMPDTSPMHGVNSARNRMGMRRSFGQGSHALDSLDQDCSTVKWPATPISRCQRRRYLYAQAVQFLQNTKFGKRARRRRSSPYVTVTADSGDHAAA